MRGTPPSIDDVAAFLSEWHGDAVSALEPLSGGFWSSAYAYRVGERELVVRVGEVRDGFDMDREAMGFAGPDLPIPVVLEVGDALGASFAISERHHGRFLETVAPDEADRSGPTLMRLLGALRSVPADLAAPAEWFGGHDPVTSTWRRWLTAGLVDDPAQLVHGWRATLAADARLDRLFRACETRISELLDACPERRDLVHGDLLHANVLVDEDASRVNAVFSWKCSVRGDFLYDAAWCTFWGRWHLGIGAIGVLDRTLREPSVADALVDASLRHHCYELQIGAVHLAFSTWSNDEQWLPEIADHTAMLLERGPR